MMERAKQMVFFYSWLISGRYCSVFFVEEGDFIYYVIANRKGMLTGKDRWGELLKKVYEIWLDNPALRN